MSLSTLSTNQVEITEPYGPRASKVWLDEQNFHVELTDGRLVVIPLLFYPTICDASKESRENFRFIGNGWGIHWPELDVDIDIEGLIMGRKELPHFAKKSKDK